MIYRPIPSYEVNYSGGLSIVSTLSVHTEQIIHHLLKINTIYYIYNKGIAYHSWE